MNNRKEVNNMEKKIHNKLLLLNEIVLDFIKPEENSKTFGGVTFNQISIYGRWHYGLIFNGVLIAYTKEKILNFEDEGYDLIQWIDDARHEICEAVAEKAEQKYLANHTFA